MAVKAAPVGVLEDGTVFYAPLGEVLHDGDDLVCCHLCGRWLRKVGGTHLRVGHGWTLAEYREAFRLLQSIPTCSRDLSAGMRRHAQARLGQKGFGTPPSDAGGSIRPVPGWRSLGRVRPDLAAELHESRNGELDAGGVAAASHRKAWWRCKDCGHEWEATVDNRVVRGAGCPRCARWRQVEEQGAVERERSVAVKRPDLAAELHPERNPGLDPYALAASSGRSVWWRCGSCGHEWKALVSNRAAGTGCPACWQSRRAAVQSVVAPERSLSRRAPWLVAELHPTRNPGLDPDTLGSRSSRRVWWACSSCGHEWQALVSSRSVGDGCPPCARRRQRERGPRPVSMERSLAVRRPELVAELHPTRNRGIDPTALGAGSGWKAWWRCGVCGHDWAATVGNRTNGSGCPRCAREPNSVS